MFLFNSGVRNLPFRKSILIFLVLLIQSCSKTEIGEELSKSFDVPREESTETIKGDQIEAKKNPRNIRAINKDKKNKLPVTRKRKEGGLAKEKKKSMPFDLSAIPFSPQPYRITIKLSGANPSAPAESVTKALRKAGVSFEVEKIEKVQLPQSLKTTSVRGNRR